MRIPLTRPAPDRARRREYVLSYFTRFCEPTGAWLPAPGPGAGLRAQRLRAAVRARQSWTQFASGLRAARHPVAARFA